MTHSQRTLVVIGGGIAGLCTAVQARRCGYAVELLEQHDSPGGLATSWRRGDYVFETCLHWLVGSRPGTALYPRWLEVCDLDRLTFLYPEVFVQLENERGEHLAIYADTTRMEAELLRQAPADAAEIRRFAAAVRQIADCPLPEGGADWSERVLTVLRMLPSLPTLRHWSRLSIEEYGQRFTHPLLRSLFGGGPLGSMSMLALLFTLAWMGRREAGYPIGGSQALIRLIVERLVERGGRLRLGAPVEQILVEDDVATGVRLADGETITADWVVSAADGHATIYQLLGGRYADHSVHRRYEELETFPSYLQVSFGIRRDLSHLGGYWTRVLDAPLQLDPMTMVPQLSFRCFHFDPSFAPAGKTPVTCLLPTRDVAFWSGLRAYDPAQYEAEKQRVADSVLAVLERAEPGISHAVEVVDVATPASVMRYTGNWKGSMEGWLPTPRTGFRALPRTLPNLRRFVMVGQWVSPGGGLPSGLMTARGAMRAICRQDGVAFPA